MKDPQTATMLLAPIIGILVELGTAVNACGDQQSVTTSNSGMQMTVGSSGRITGVRVDGKDALISRGVPWSGFSLRDFSRNQDTFKPLECEVSSRGDIVHFRWSGDGLGLVARMRPVEKGWHIRGSVWRADNNERFFSLRFGIPLDVAEWVWWDHVAKSRPLVPTKDCATLQPQKPHGGSAKDCWKTDGLGSGPNGRQDMFPVTAISSNRGTVAYAVPMDKQYFRYVMYDAKKRLFALTYDFAMVNGQANYSHEVPFDFYVLSPASKWGLRAAVEEYFRIFSQWAGTGRMVPQPWGGESIGDGGAAEPPLCDFGFRAAGRSADTVTRHMTVDIMDWPFYPYIEPTMYQQYHGDSPADVEPSLERILERIKHNASSDLSDVFVTKQWSDPSLIQAQSKALIGNIVMGPDGKILPPIMRSGLPWIGGSGWSATFVLNLDPNIPGGMGQTRLTDCLHRRHLKVHNPLTHPESRGQYLDSFGYSSSGFALADFNPMAVKYSSMPPTFKAGSLQPCTTIAGGAISWCEQLRILLTPRQKRIRTNTGTIYGPLPWHCIDYTGPEGVEPGAKGLFADVIYNQRTFMYHKPVSVLNIFPDYNFLKGLLLTDCIPGNHVNGDWISNIPADKKKPVRSYFRKLMPIFRLLHRLEWQPVTYAEGDASPRVERYGNTPGPIAFVIVNESKSKRKVVTHVDAEPLKLSPGAWCYDPLGETTPGWKHRGNMLEISVELLPLQTAVVVVGDLPAHREFRRMFADDKLDDIRTCMREYILRKHRMHPLTKEAYGLKAEVSNNAIQALKAFADSIQGDGPITKRIKELASEAAEQLGIALALDSNRPRNVPEAP